VGNYRGFYFYQSENSNMSLEEQIGGLTAAIEKLTAHFAGQLVGQSTTATVAPIASPVATEEPKELPAKEAVAEKKKRSPNKSTTEKPLAEKSNEDLMAEALEEEDAEEAVEETATDDLPDLHPGVKKGLDYYNTHVKGIVTEAVKANKRDRLTDPKTGIFANFEYITDDGEIKTGFAKATDLPSKYWGKLILEIKALLEDDIA
jgi:hypothetical protein